MLAQGNVAGGSRHSCRHHFKRYIFDSAISNRYEGYTTLFIKSYLGEADEPCKNLKIV